MTEIVDKTLIERLILEHSDRLELEINHKARADAWKFYYRVRVDHVIRPFAVCRACFRVLHCDSRSGTASLLRHPCNPLSERSPVNRAVKLNAKLNLPPDALLKVDPVNGGEPLKGDSPPRHDSGSPSHRLSPSVTGTLPGGSCPSPTSTGSPPTAAQPVMTAAAAVPCSTASMGRKRKAGVTPSAFPLDLRLLHLPQMMAAVAANPLTALNLANTSAFLADPQHLQHLQHQLQQSHLENILREHHHQQQQINQERESKRNRAEEQRDSPGEASSSIGWPRTRVKKEKADTSEGGSSPHLEGRSSPTCRNRLLKEEEDPTCPTKEFVQYLVNTSSPRVTFAEKDCSSHYISDVWSRFRIVYVDDVLRPYAACNNCLKVVTYTKYSGTGGLLRHRCSPSERSSSFSAVHEASGDLYRPPTSPTPSVQGDALGSSLRVDASFGAPSRNTPILNCRGGDTSRPSGQPAVAPIAAVSSVARALLRYMCQDFVPGSSVDTSAFHQLLWTLLNLGASHGNLPEEEHIPSSEQLLRSFLQPMVCDSRESIARGLQDQTHLSVSMHRRPTDDESAFLALAVHCINHEFELQSHALGTRRVYKGDSNEDAVHDLLAEFFQEVLSPASLREKHLTVLSDGGEPCDLASTGVNCLWHCVDNVLDGLKELPVYQRVCEELTTLLASVAQVGIKSVPRMNPNEYPGWEDLLHCLAFVSSRQEQLMVMRTEGLAPTHSVVLDRQFLEEAIELLSGVRRCLAIVRDPARPTLNQVVLCKAKLLQLCASNSGSAYGQQIKDYLVSRFEKTLQLAPIHLVASFLDPRCKSLKVLNESEKCEVHRLVLEMMKAVSITEANTGVLNLKKTQRGSPPPSSSPKHDPSSSSSQETHPFREYMDNPLGPDLSVSDSEEIMAYVNMKVHLEDDDILGWWAGPSAAGLPTLRRLARKILAVPATCSFAFQLSAHAVMAFEKMGISEPLQLNNILHMKYNMS